MKEEEVYLLRKIRQKIIGICREICVQKQKAAVNDWNILENELMQFKNPEIICDKLLEECRVCIANKNYVRLYDLLRYEVDSKVAMCLSQISEEDRVFLSDRAQEKNEDALKKYHKKIYASMQKTKESERVIFSYSGTENVSIFVREGEYQYQIFSSVNPWLESANFVDRIEKKELDEILVLGFSGGHLIREFEKKFRRTKIKVYLPNMDIFRTVINHILVCETLQNDNLEFYFDFTGLSFFMQLQEKAKQNENFAFYIDKSELRACVGREDEADRLIWDIRDKMLCGSLKMCEMKDLVGTKIVRHIMNSLDPV